MRRNFWINAGFFQLAWPACVLGAAYGHIWPSLLLIVLFAGWQLHPARAHPNDWLLVFLFACTGIVVDTVWVQTGLVSYSTALPWAGFAPVWLVSLWVALALAVNHSLKFFRQRWFLWGLILCVASPFSYWMAERFGAVVWQAPDWLVILMLGPIWALVVGALFALAQRMDDRLTTTAPILSSPMETLSK